MNTTTRRLGALLIATTLPLTAAATASAATGTDSGAGTVSVKSYNVAQHGLPKWKQVRATAKATAKVAKTLEALATTVTTATNEDRAATASKRAAKAKVAWLSNLNHPRNNAAWENRFDAAISRIVAKAKRDGKVAFAGTASAAVAKTATVTSRQTVTVTTRFKGRTLKAKATVARTATRSAVGYAHGLGVVYEDKAWHDRAVKEAAEDGFSASYMDHGYDVPTFHRAKRNAVAKASVKAKTKATAAAKDAAQRWAWKSAQRKAEKRLYTLMQGVGQGNY